MSASVSASTVVPDGLGDEVEDRRLAPLAVEVDHAAVPADHLWAADGAMGVADEVLHQRDHRVLVAVGLVGLEHRELRRVGGVEPLVAEGAADLVDPVDAADHRPLEVELQRDAQQHLLVERVEVGAERSRGGTAVGELQDRRLHLDEPVLVERAAQALQHRCLLPHHLPRLRSQHHVDVAQPDPRLVGQRAVLVGQRPQRLGRERPRGRLHRELAPAAGDHLAAHREQVAEVDERLEVRERLLADVGQRQHHLQLGAVALAQPDEAQLAGVAQEHHAAGDRDLVTGVGVGLERLDVVRRPDLAPACGCARPPRGRARCPARAAAPACRGAPASARGGRPPSHHRRHS